MDEKWIADTFQLPRHVLLTMNHEERMQYQAFMEGVTRTACLLRCDMAYGEVERPEADRRERKMMKKILIRIRLWRICRACGIKKLTEPQKRVLLTGKYEELWQWERRSGKTLTACLYALLYYEKPMKLSRRMLHPAIPDPDGAINCHVARFVTDEFVRLWKLCSEAGIRVCGLIVNDPTWHLGVGNYKSKEWAKTRKTVSADGFETKETEDKP